MRDCFFRPKGPRAKMCYFVMMCKFVKYRNEICNYVKTCKECYKMFYFIQDSHYVALFTYS